MKAAIYSRKSMFTGKGDSVENQVQMCKDYGNRLNVDEYLIYEDEGYSGGNVNRPKFQELLQDVKKKKFDVLICYRLDRISRNVADFSSTLELLQDNNISFVSIKEQFDTSTPMGKAMVYIASVFAQLERETIAERVRDNMLELAKSGRWLGGQTPLGFESEKISYFDAEMKERTMYKLSPEPKELELVKLIYNKYLETGSIHLTLKYLLSNNIKGKNGGEFASMSINDILRNPAYAKSNEMVLNYLEDKGMNICGTANGNGILIYNKRNSKYKKKSVNEWIAAVSKHKGIIPANTWLEVQKTLDKNSKKDTPRQGTSKKALLSGVLKCSRCGAPMRVTYGRKRKDGTSIYYYTCTMKAHSGKTRCDNPNIRGDYLEKNIITELKNLNSDVVIKGLEEHKKQLAATTENSIIKNISKEIEEKKKEMDSLINKLSKIESDIASEFILSKVDSLGKEIKELEVNLLKRTDKKKENSDIELNIEIVLQAIKEFNDFFNSVESFKDDELTIQRKRYLLERAVDEIRIDGETNGIDIDLWRAKKK
ncbi:serine recombinase [Clostridium botulinum]|uniref:Recombinase family protein n=1 Tax=Clostridium botulinum TaxID=1491 RepID=A0ABD7CGS9_CLOBO|nr:recombinase family protein [Clostridium botulinum]KGO13532.1 serine recombinase [Clostridium botulinum]QRI52318.1 recombinase family protein [Clostridium botulinum]